MLCSAGTSSQTLDPPLLTSAPVDQGSWRCELNAGMFASKNGSEDLEAWPGADPAVSCSDGGCRSLVPELLAEEAP